MPRRKKPVPSYLLHKSSGQARVVIDGRDIYLGRFGSPESVQEYERVCAEFRRAGRLANVSDRNSPPAATGGGQRRPPAPFVRPAHTSVAEVLLAFMKHAQQHYRREDGTLTNEVVEYRYSLRVVRELYGHVPVAEFGPLALKAVRQRMVEKGWCRNVVNRRVGRIKRVFKWAASEELVPQDVHYALTTVTGLQRGRTAAPESVPVEPVPVEVVERTIPHLNPVVAGMVRVQLLTGCRPQDVCQLRPCDIDRTGPVWVFRPEQHKGRHRGKPRTVWVGPKAEALLASFEPADPLAYYFRPADATAARNAARSAARKTPRYASHMARNAARRKAAPKRVPKTRYTTHAYDVAVRRACERAGAEPWSPNRLRHTFATEIRRTHGLEVAQVLLGHERCDVTQVYAERNRAVAEKVAGEVG